MMPEACESNVTLTNQPEHQLAVTARYKSGSQSSTCASLLACLASMKEHAIDISNITEVVSNMPVRIVKNSRAGSKVSIAF